MSVEFQFKNIGPIKDAKMELGDLTIIAGANNSGKTYLAYTLYGFLQYMKIITINKNTRLFHEPNFKVNEYGNELTISKENALKFLEHITKNFSANINKIFSTQEEQFKNAILSCKIQQQSNKNYRILFPKHIADFKPPTKEELNFTITLHRALPDDDEAFIFESSPVFQIAILEIINYLMNGIYQISPFILPAERFGVSLFYKELDFAKNRLVEALQNMSDKHKKRSSSSHKFIRIIEGGARYAKPIHDNIDFVRDLNLETKKGGDFADDKFFDEIKKMMGASYRYVDNDILFVSQKKKQGKFDIPLHLASSSGKGLAAFYFYLRHVAKKGQLLIIDEPESHLDTENQILLARLLARCVNAGLKILITTHSDYIIKELNNLIMLSHDFKEKSAFIKKFKYNAKDYLNKEKVKPYICENGGVSPCIVDTYGMDIAIFDKTIDKINNVSRTLVNCMPEQEG